MVIIIVELFVNRYRRKKAKKEEKKRKRETSEPANRRRQLILGEGVWSCNYRADKAI